MSGAAPVLAAEGVTVRVDDRAILDDVSLALHAGEVLALVGPNGAGKSTLLSVLSGELAPAAGTVTLHGTDVTGLRVRELARRRAVLAQEQRVSFAFRTVDVVRMGRAPWRGHDAELDDERIVAIAMADADVSHLAAREIPTLSGGEKARTSFARVLAQDTPVLLLDEPTAALDIHHQERVLERLRQDLTGGGAVVVLHDLGMAAAHADRIALLSSGRLRALGTPDEVLRAELLSDVYGHDIEVLRHPRTGQAIVLPRREAPSRLSAVAIAWMPDGHVATYPV